MPESKVHDVIIIGSGPAGLTAALYAARANLKPVVFEGPEPGGQLTITTDVENFPGFPEGIQGPELMNLFRQQADRFGSQTLYEIVESVDFSARPFTIVTQQGTYRAEAVIIATGVSARWLELESEERFRGKGVSACATCDGFFFRDKIVAVVGGGDTAIEDALFLTRFTSRVYVIHRRDELRASKIMANRVFQNEKLEVVWNSVVTEVLGDDEVGVTGIRLKDTVTEEEREMELDGLFVAIGHVPRTAIFKEFLETDEEGYLITDDVKTKIEGVFACGDIIDRVYRQAVTAAGSGCRAAIEVERWLEANQ